MAVLRVVKGPNVGHVFDVSEERVVLGRAPDCNIVLEHAAVSRLHAKIEWVDGDFFIEDLQSRNGVRVNGQSSVRHRLRDNDLIKICGYHLAFEDEGSRDEPQAPVDAEDGSSDVGSVEIDREAVDTARALEDDTQSE